MKITVSTTAGGQLYETTATMPAPTGDQAMSGANFAALAAVNTLINNVSNAKLAITEMTVKVEA